MDTVVVIVISALVLAGLMYDFRRKHNSKDSSFKQFKRDMEDPSEDFYRE